MARDMTKAQFDKKCKQHGFEPEGFMGYYRTPSGVNVSILNARPTRRAALAYLIAQNQQWTQRQRGDE